MLRNLLAYFIDWNYGLLPYYPLLLAAALVLLPLALLRRCARYPLLLLAMVAMLFGCAFMANIDCGMTGIARYNAWAGALLPAAVVLAGLPLLKGWAARALAGVLACSFLYTGALVAAYGGVGADPNAWHSLTPLAKQVVARCPVLYWPAPSTFYARANSRPGLPCAYCRDDNDYLRKLYLNADEAAALRPLLASSTPAALEWLDQKFAALGETRTFISIPARWNIFLKEYTVSFALGTLDAAQGTVDADGVLTTEGAAGYAMLGPDETLAAGSYRAVLSAQALNLPAAAPAQFQVGINGADGYTLVGTAPLAADGAAEVSFELPVRTDGLTYRVYQNDGAILQIRGVQILRVS